MLTNQSYTYNGHAYKVTRIENSHRFTVVRDNRKVRYISEQALQVAIANKEHQQVLERLFNDEGK